MGTRHALLSVKKLETYVPASLADCGFLAANLFAYLCKKKTNLVLRKVDCNFRDGKSISICFGYSVQKPISLSTASGVLASVQ